MSRFTDRAQAGHVSALAWSECVTRSASSNVVRPARAFSTADARSVTMPAARAWAATEASVASLSSTWRIAASTSSTS